MCAIGQACCLADGADASRSTASGAAARGGTTLRTNLCVKIWGWDGKPLLELQRLDLAAHKAPASEAPDSVQQLAA